MRSRGGGMQHAAGGGEAGGGGAVCSRLWCGCQADFWIGFRHDVK